MRTSESIKELAGAFAKAQGQMRGATKDAKNPHFRNDYATLASVIEAGRAALYANGLSVLQGLSAEGSALIVTTRLLHESGEWIEDSLTVPLAKHDAQGMGSAATYGRRYALAAMLGIAQVDDDGNDAAARAPERPAMAAQVVADLKASLDEADSLDQLRKRTKSAMSVCQQGGDGEALQTIRDYAANLARKFEVPA